MAPRLSPLIALAAVMAACGHAPPPCPAASAGPPTAEDARRFLAEANARFHALKARLETAEYIKSTHITQDTERNAAEANAALMAFMSEAIPRAASFRDVELDADTRRALNLLRASPTLPAPSDPALREELAGVSARLEGHYGEAKYCKADGDCRDLGALSKVLTTADDWDALVDAWAGWHDTAAESKANYARLVELGNLGARELGFSDVGELWRSGYDMPPDALRAEVDRLWSQVQPLYARLHCFVRRKLAERWGADKVPADGPIPAHLFGNMWSQDWSALYPLVEPHPGAGRVDLTAALEAKEVGPEAMVRYGERFFTSIGFPALPDTFWRWSMFDKPADREVVCHASAWDMTQSGEVRIKMCIEPTEEDFITVHHELGHIYYYLAYKDRVGLWHEGANGGFHEAIGDAVALSVTPGYLADVGLAPPAPLDEAATLNEQMRRALDKIAFLPFGRVIDQWRWDVFSGAIPPERYTSAWWELRRRYQGIAPPVARDDSRFDPGAKYHVPANVSYTRYFIAAVLQFQLHRALCREAGHRGPLYTCSIQGSEAAGAKLWRLLSLGASRPWPDALEEVTGQREMDATAIVDYFAPLSAWLDTHNAGHRCGW